ncbi:HD domain-containing protein [Candidatus Dojkabacteria bacterium]|nr:HD domain-containing protein [Candidatus Dojkabacteria bacterium]
MDTKYENVWNVVTAKLKGVGKKDYVLHSKLVTLAMEEIIAGEGGNKDVLIPAAMLHDIGWVNVPEKYQADVKGEDKEIAEKLHLEKAPEIIKEVLEELGYSKELINSIIRVVINHKSKEPNGDTEIACMVDADNLSDTYKEGFYSNVVSYGLSPTTVFEYRSKNKFFTDTARSIFEGHLKDRKAEIESGEADNIVSKIKDIKK